ncbi:MAG: SIR2 family protein, partial [Actinobacteria bacterium]|nr:SIR2 family protein [Actinomycetota bacterium]
MEAVFAVESLAQALREDRLVVLVGAAASASTRDERGREYLGLPTPAEFVESVAHQLRYVTAGMAFEAACDTIYQHQHRAGLEDLLCQRYHVPTNFEIPPAHRILSWLPCSAFVTSNYDQFIERALEQERRRLFVIIENTDVPRLKRGYTPVIKYHGCVSRPRTMVATAADLTAARSERRLVQQLIAVTLANRTLLVIGHGLSDEDLREHV